MIRIYVKMSLTERLHLVDRLRKVLDSNAIYDVKSEYDEYIAIPNEGGGRGFYNSIENWLSDEKIEYESIEQRFDR